MGPVDDQALYSSVVVAIPFEESPDASDEDEEIEEWGHFMPGIRTGDIRDGTELRFKAYIEVWTRCSLRIQGLVRELHLQITEDLLEFIRQSYAPQDIILPFAELPVAIVVGDPNSAMVVFDAMSVQLDEIATPQSASVIRLEPKDFSSVASSLRAMINRIIESKVRGGKSVPAIKKRTQVTTVAVYDLSMLEAWYDRATSGNSEPFKIIVVIPTIEVCDSTVLQHFFHICSLRIPRISLIFVLGTSASANILQTMLPLSSRVSLSVEPFLLSSGIDMFEDIIEGVFLDHTFDSTLQLTALSLAHLRDSYMVQEQSVASLLSTLQVMLMEHFSNPTSLFCSRDMLGEQRLALKRLSYPESSDFLHSLQDLVHDSIKQLPNAPATVLARRHSPNGLTNTAVLEFISEARKSFAQRAKSFRIALRLLRPLLIHIRSSTHEINASLTYLFAEALSGTVIKNEVGQMVAKIRKLSLERLHAFVARIIQLCEMLPDEAMSTVSFLIEEAKNWSVTLDELTVTPNVQKTQSKTSIYKLPDVLSVPPAVVAVAENISRGILAYFSESLAPLEDVPLKDIWHLNSTLNPVEVLNPSQRYEVLSTLKSTEKILHIRSSSATRSDTALSDLPDTAVLFRRYLDSGKMINVYDWFESFAVAMRGESRGSLSAPRRNGDRAPGAPSSAQGSGATPGRAARKRPKDSMEAENEEDGDDQADVVYGAEWRREIQARFLRSVHELEWMGLLKPTGRKKDHVLRTVYDPPSK